MLPIMPLGPASKERGLFLTSRQGIARRVPGVSISATWPLVALRAWRNFMSATILVSVMDYSLTLQFFGSVLSLISIALAVLVMRCDPIPVRSPVQIDSLPNVRRPAMFTRVGTGCLQAIFILLVAGCLLALNL